jgi:formylglycine-generating enzyme required for sulfatase activity
LYSQFKRFVMAKVGSHLRAPNYCRRYRPAARHAHPVHTTTGHIRFRCVSERADQPEIG